ncbi:MAG: hypothetical protein RDV48_20575 [Candidatus Eremiobacteraeota bacterium]|nr:hypothetical protein [Candidatus Eremiobacteraeota bacterium]
MPLPHEPVKHMVNLAGCLATFTFCSFIKNIHGKLHAGTRDEALLKAQDLTLKLKYTRDLESKNRPAGYWYWFTAAFKL